MRKAILTASGAVLCGLVVVGASQLLPRRRRSSHGSSAVMSSGARGRPIRPRQPHAILWSKKTLYRYTAFSQHNAIVRMAEKFFCVGLGIPGCPVMVTFTSRKRGLGKSRSGPGRTGVAHLSLAIRWISDERLGMSNLSFLTGASKVRQLSLALRNSSHREKSWKPALEH